MKWIVQFAGNGFPTEDQVQQVRSLPGVQVTTARARALLVEADEQGAEALHKLTEWSVDPEVTYQLPDTRQSPRS